MTDAGAEGGLGERIFRRLGAAIVRHPWYPIVFWVALLLVAAPFLGRVGSVTTNSATTLPSSAPSAQAQAEIDRLFPSAGAGSDALLLVQGPNVTGAGGQATVLALAQAISTDPKITHLTGVTTVYSAYGGYLNGTAALALGAIAQADQAAPPLDVAVNGTAWLLWGPTATFVGQWLALVGSHPTTPPASWNYPAYRATAAALGSNATTQEILQYFYSGPPGGTGTGPAGGFNGTGDCAAAPASVAPCAENVTRATLGPALPNFLPVPASQVLGAQVLGNLTLANFSLPSAQRSVGLAAVALGTGLPVGFVQYMGAQFATGPPSPATLTTWTRGIVQNGTIPSYPLPVPTALRFQFLAPSGSAELMVVSFAVPDSFTTASGGNPVYADLDEIGRIIPLVLQVTDPGGTLSVLSTGGAPLDQTENQVLSESLAIVLPLTVIVLVGITIVYFRSPLAPILTFGGLGIALALGLGGVVLIGMLVEHVDSTALTLQNTFVLGVGTDYSIFLVARYREELWKGAEPAEALVTTVTWAGQSIATSGATAAIATLALAFSGVALLEQWGMVLSLAVLIAVLVALTLVPAMLRLVGPRVFWPTTGARFARHAEETVRRRQEERTYFYRVGRAVQRRPGTTVLLMTVLSLPLFFVAVTAATSYDFYGQLPSGHAATDGLSAVGQQFGAGRAFPILVLVTMQSPLLVGNTTNVTEFADLAAFTDQLNGTANVALADSPTGALGAPLADWLSYPRLPAAQQMQLSGLLSGYLGNDQRTVWVTVYPSVGGLSSEAVALLGTLRSESQTFQGSHPTVAAMAFGGGSAVTSDIERQTATATQRLVLAVSIGLVLVLFLVLRSWIIPPLAVATIGVSLGWAWGITNLLLQNLLGLPIFYFVPTVLFILILGLGIDYNIFLLTRVREERLRGHPSDEATVHALATTGGIITAAAVILASAFAILTTGQFLLLQAIGFSVAAAVVLDAMVVRTYLVPASLFLLGERVWQLPRRRRAASEGARRP